MYLVNSIEVSMSEFLDGDIVWKNLNMEAMEHFKAGNFGLYRNTRLSMYNFLMKEKHYKMAFDVLCEVALYDLSGLGNGENEARKLGIEKQLFVDSIKYYFPYKDSILILAPAVIGYFEVIQCKLGLSDEAYKKVLIDEFNKYQLRRRVFTNEECAEIVLNEMGNHPRKLRAIYKGAEERIKEELKNN